jgi:single-stranded-DNA-specific exonuclease
MPTTAPSASLTPLRPRWAPTRAPEPSAVDRLVSALGLPAVVCRLLAQRGYAEPSLAKVFLRPGRDHLHAGRAMAGMDAAVARIVRAIDRSESILVHGDYDVDGICATALLVRALEMMGGRPIAFVPDRIAHGYDLGSAGVAAADAAGARLIVTADCGISAHAAVDAAGARGIDVVVTDHHTPPPVLPAAVAVVNPNRSDCGYPDKGLAGVAVAFKLACEVARARDFPEERLHALLDFVAIATVADLAPLTAENRALVRWGISVLQRTPNPGLRALLDSSGLTAREEITAGRIGFVLAPRLNAAGRLGDAMRGVRLLLTADREEARTLAADLEAENRRRRDLDERILGEAVGMLERDYDPARDRGVVLASREWHPGVIGIVASRVVERIHRPTVLIALDENEGKGSARSIRGFHLYHAFEACAGHLVRYGGHRAAAGCSLLPSNVEAFREAFNEVATGALAEDDLLPEITIDAEISLAEATLDLCRILKHFGPFGIGNPSPVFVARGVHLAGPARVVGQKHLRLSLVADDTSLAAIGFGMADRVLELESRRPVIDIAFRLEENSWVDGSGRRRPPAPQARLLDFRASP